MNFLYIVLPTSLNKTYRKIPTISPGAYFGQRAFSPHFSWGGGGGAYTWTYICVLKTLGFFSSNCNFFEIFCSQPVFMTEIFTFLFWLMYLQLSIPPKFYKKPLDIKSGVQCSVFYFFPLGSMLCLNLIIPNITPGGLFSGELIHGRSFFRLKGWFLYVPGLIHGGAYYRNFTVFRFASCTGKCPGADWGRVWKLTLAETSSMSCCCIVKQ